MTAYAPSGQQVEFRHGEQRAVVVEAGGGLRSYDVAGVAVLDGFGETEMASGGRGQVLLPWPNRLAGGKWEDGGTVRQLPLSEAGAGNAIHGLVRWATWDVQPAGTTGARARHLLLPQPGYPFRLACQLDYRLGPEGLTVTATVRNESDRSAPFGLGFHPYLAAPSGSVDEISLTVPADTHLLLDHGIPSGREPVDGTAHDFRTSREIGPATLDDAFADLRRDADGIVRVGAGAVTLWAGPGFDYLQVFTGDTLGPDRRRRGLAVEPMTCPPNALATGEGLVHLDPGASATLSWGITPG
jgi:aldose 1-epimerase